MKKISRIAIAAGALLVLVGFVWSGFSWQHIKDDIQSIGHQDRQDKQASFDAGNLKNLKVDVDNVRVAIDTQSSGNQVTVDYFETKTDKFSVTSSDDTVSVLRARPAASHFLCIFRCIGDDSAITIHVPATSSLAYDLTADNAAVSFNNVATLQAQTMRIISSNSTVRLQQINASGNIDARSSNGNLKLQDVTTAGRLSLNGSNGGNDLLNVRAVTITSRMDNGSTTLDTVSANDLTSDTSNATITLNRLAVGHSTLTSDNGGVRGTVVGPKSDYDIKFASSNGSIRLDGTKQQDGAYASGNDKAPRSLSVHASNAAIDISFEK